jgi:outer membrane lipoprotein carrier protein
MHLALTTAFVASLLAPAPSRAPRQAPVDAALDRAVAAWQKIRTARGTFEQTITNPLTGSAVSSRGEFAQQMQPSRFSFDFVEPKGDRIVADGKYVWLWLPSTNPKQVIRMPAADGTAGNLDLAAQFFSSPRARYTISDGGAVTVGGRATRAMTLVPRSANGTFTRATLWVDTADGMLRQFETVEQNGLKRQVRITKWEVNAPVEASRFRFSPPKGVKVVDGNALGVR